MGLNLDRYKLTALYNFLYHTENLVIQNVTYLCGITIAAASFVFYVIDRKRYRCHPMFF